MQPLLTIWRTPKKLKMELPYYPVVPLRGIYMKTKQKVQKDTRTLISTAVLFIIAKTWELPNCSIRKWIKAMLYVHSGIALSQKKKKKTFCHCSNMGEFGGY